MLRVIHSARVWLPQTQTWMHNQARALPEHVENHVVCETTENLDVYGMAHIHALEESRLRYGWDKLLRGCRLRPWLGHLPSVARTVGADLVHSHFGHIGWTDHRAVARVGLPHVVTFYGQDLSYLPRHDPRWLARYRELFSSVRLVLCEGPHMAERIAELGCPREVIRVHPLGVALGELELRPRQLEASSPVRVLIAGSFTEKKGIPDAIAALGRVDPAVDLEITVIGDSNGKPRNDAERARILAAVEQSPRHGAIRLLGYQSHAALIDQAYRHHVFLSPSVHASDGDTEGGAPVTITEMAATGMPIVSTTHCDIPFVVRHGEGGLLADEHDVDALAAHLEHLATHPETWGGLGVAARKRVEEHFDMERQGRVLAEIYGRVVARAG